MCAPLKRSAQQYKVRQVFKQDSDSKYRLSMTNVIDLRTFYVPLKRQPNPRSDDQVRVPEPREQDRPDRKLPRPPLKSTPSFGLSEGSFAASDPIKALGVWKVGPKEESLALQATQPQKMNSPLGKGNSPHKRGSHPPFCWLASI